MSIFVFIEDGFFQLELNLRIHDVKPEVAVNIYVSINVSINECLDEKYQQCFTTM
jgi:hypothetical protein